MSSRWLLPAGVGVAIVALSTLPHALASSGDPTLSGKSPAELLAAAHSSDVRAFSGTVRITAALGLPSLPDGIGGSSMGLAGLLTGSHDLSVAADGPDKQRIALLGDLTENDFIRNGPDLWTYDSSSGAVTHRTLGGSGSAAGPDATASPDPADSAAPTDSLAAADGAAPADRADSAAPAASAEPTAVAEPTGDATASPEAELTPNGAAQEMLSKLDPTTTVATDGTTRVAGRDAYVLMLTPKTSDTLIGDVRIALDAVKSVPLSVTVTPRGSTAPGLTIAFTDISFATPSASTFTFTPPSGATVSGGGQQDGSGNTGSAGAATGPSTFGSGWATVRQIPADVLGSVTGGLSGAGSDSGSGDHGPSVMGWLDRIATSVPQGHVLQTRLFSVLITPDGRLFVGAVPAQTVEAAASATS